MGEIAEAMLDGALCECCGSYIDDEGGSGFPRYCSAQCARDRGATFPRVPVFRAMSPDFDPFAKARRWLTAAARAQGITPDAAPAYLAKLAKRGFVSLDRLIDDGGPQRYFITDAGRAEIERIRANSK